MNIDEIRAAAEEILRGDTDTVSLLQSHDWYKNRATWLADAFLSHPYGVLKPLEWLLHNFSETWIASAMRNSYEVRRTLEGNRYWINGTCEPCDSIEHGKQLCQQHFENAVASRFTTIGATE